MRRFPGQLMIIIALLGVFLIQESKRGFGNSLDEAFTDWLAANGSRRAATAPCTLVTISDSSLEAEHHWPWSPLDFALFLQGSLEFKPSVLAIQNILDWPSRPEEAWEEQAKRGQYENILRDYILKTPRVLLGAELGLPDDPDIIPPIQQVTFFSHVKGDTSGLPEFITISAQPSEKFRPDPRLQPLGYVNLPAEPVARYVPLLMRYRGEIVPSFVLQAAMLWFQVTADQVSVEAGKEISLANKIRIPINAKGEMRVDYGVEVTRVTFDELLVAVEQMRAKHTPIVSVGALKDRLVLLGRTDSASRTLSLPSGQRGSAGDFFSASIATIQNGRFARRASDGMNAGILLAAIALCIAVVRWKKTGAVLGCFLIFIGYLLTSMTVFSITLVSMPFLLPTGLLVFLAVFRLAGGARESGGAKS